MQQCRELVCNPFGDGLIELAEARSWGFFFKVTLERVTLEKSPSKVRAPKISKTTPCKVAGGRHGYFESKLTRRANQGHFFTIPQS